MPEKKPVSPIVWVSAGIIGLLIVCCCVLVLAGVYLFQQSDSTSTATEAVPTFTPAPVNQTAPSVPAEASDNDTLQTLENAVVPENNPAELACRLKGICGVPPTVPPPAAPLQVGATEQFWATDIDTNEPFQVTARLAYATDHVYFWVQEGVSAPESKVKKLVDTFENEIYPTNRSFFGSEWTPGVDGDPHIYILYTRGIGSSIAGYFSSADEVPPEVHPYSNAHEMFVFNADNTPLDDPFTYGVLAHEFQHMIHWAQDRNETSWLNEGFSELAAYLNGYDPGGFDYAFLRQPDLQLNDWPNDPNATTPHYGAGFLFTTYFLDRFGPEATQALAAQPQNSLDSVDLTLEQIGATDPLTGAPLRADDVFQDWTLANLLNDPSILDGRYAYHNYSLPMTYRPVATLQNCPTQGAAYKVRQYGTDVIRITCPGEHTLVFQGAATTGVLPVDAYSGKYTFWSNKGDESDMTLTRQFDLRNVSSATLRFHTWYDIEEDYDYVYLEASTDGEHWQILTTPSGTDENPSGNSYGWGYNGATDGWIEETVDLSDYAGKQVWLRFEYVTDAAVNGEGMLIDDIAIPEIDYFSDFESDDGGWEAAGFVRIQNVLPQTFRLALVTKRSNGVDVAKIALDDSNYLEIPISIGGNVKEVLLVVSGTTRHTREAAQYQIEIR
jgi:hypothetical protein